MPDDLTTALEAAFLKTTPGEWRVQNWTHTPLHLSGIAIDEMFIVAPGEMLTADSDFAVLAHNRMPEILAALKEREDYRKAADAEARAHDECLAQLQTVHAHVKEALELLGVDVNVETGRIPDSWTLREECHGAARKMGQQAAEIERLHVVAMALRHRLRTEEPLLIQGDIASMLDELTGDDRLRAEVAELKQKARVK